MRDDFAVRWSFGTQTQDEDELRDQAMPTPTRQGKKQTDAHVFTALSQHDLSLGGGGCEGEGKSVRAHSDIITISDNPVPSTVPPTTDNPFTTISISSSSPYSISLSAAHNPDNSVSISQPSSLVQSSTLATHSFAAEMETGEGDPLEHNKYRPTASKMSDQQVSDDPKIDLVAENILRPVQHDLKKLRTLMKPEAYPAGDSGVKVKPYMRVVTERLLPIGRFIVNYVQNDGALELRLCRYIANHHWPLPTQSDTHLNIQAKYRNALFYEQIRASRLPPLPLQEQVKQPSPPPPPPSEHATESESGADDVPPLEPGTSFAQGMQGMKKKLTNATAKVFSNFVARSNTSKPEEEESQQEEGEGDEES